MRQNSAKLIVLLALLLPVLIQAQSDEIEYFDPQSGLRVRDYNQKTPAFVPGAVALDTRATLALIAFSDVLLLDVLPINDVHFDELDGSWPKVPDHEFIENSLWLPNVGYGVPSAEMLDYLAVEVGAATQGNLDQPIIVYCQADCWMGWNAVQHLRDLGYRALYWFADGVDGYKAAGLPLVKAQPQPVNLD